MSSLQEELRRACNELSIQVVMPFELSLPSGRKIMADALVPQLGAVNGMLVVREFDEVSGATNELIELGYGFSVMDEPESLESYDLGSWMEIFKDWSWTAEASKKPDWM